DYGIEVLADETYGPTDADMTPQLTNIKGKDGVQAVLNPGFGQGPAIVTRNYAQLVVGLPLYQSHGVASDGFIELAGAQAAEGVRLPGTALLVASLLPESDPQRAVVVAYKDAYEKATGKPVSTFGGYAHDALRILVDAIFRAGSAEPSAIRDAIEATSGLVGTTGTVTMSAEDHLGLDLSAFRMLEIENGGWKVVEQSRGPCRRSRAASAGAGGNRRAASGGIHARTPAIPSLRDHGRRGLRARRPRLHDHLQRLRRRELRPGRVRHARRHDHRLLACGRPPA